MGEDGDAAAAPGQRQPPLLPRGNVVRVVTLPNEAAMHAALRLVECLVERDTFVRKYAEVMKRRLLARPPPGRVRDELLDQSKRICEKEAIDYLRSRLVDASDLGSLRSIYESYQPTYVSGTEEGGAPSDAAKETKLVVNVLDWRYWDTNAAEYQDMQQVTANQPQGTSGAAGGVPSQEAPLPVPHELLTVMDRFQNDYQSKHGGKTLKWHLLANAYCTFTLQYPKDEGRVTTVHGSVLLNQLFLAIAQYKRQGVAFTTLAHRAKMEPKKVMALLGRFIKQDKLLTLVPGSGSGESQCVSLNYDFTRPPESRHGEFAGGWPKPVRFANAINREEQEAIRISRMMQVQVSVIQIMKSKHAIAFEELTEQVKAKVANKFDLSMQLLKAVIEELVEKAFIERAIMDNGAKGFHYLS